jgi:hypothetical protein
VRRTTAGTYGKRHRYYRIRDSEAEYPAHDIMRRQIPAAPVEEAVLKVPKETFASPEEVGPLIEEHVKAELTSAPTDKARRELLEQEFKKLVSDLS